VSDPELPPEPSEPDALRDALRSVPEPSGIDVDAHFGSVLHRARAQRRMRRGVVVAATSGLVALGVLGAAVAVDGRGDGPDPVEVADGSGTTAVTTDASCTALPSECSPVPEGDPVPCASDAQCDDGTVDTGPPESTPLLDGACPVPAELPTGDASAFPGRLVVGSAAPGTLATAGAGDTVQLSVEHVDPDQATWSSGAVISRWDGTGWSATYLVEDLFGDASTVTELGPEGVHLVAVTFADAATAGHIDLPDDVSAGLLRVELGAYALPFAATSARATMYAYVLVGCDDARPSDTTSSSAVAATTTSTTPPPTDPPEPTTTTSTSTPPAATVTGTYTCGPADGHWIAAIGSVSQPARVRVQIEVGGVPLGQSDTVTAGPGESLDFGFDPLLTDDAYAAGVGTLRLLDADAPGVVLAESTVTLRLTPGVQCG
jgi:hypothetical protein